MYGFTMGRNSKRQDTKVIKQIRALREQLAENRAVTWDEILFAQVKTIQGTAREHAIATFPLFPQPEIALQHWTNHKREFNVFGDEEREIIGVPHKLKGLDGKIRQFTFMELAYHDTAGDAKRHQDLIVKGGQNKSRKLGIIEQDPNLKRKHSKELQDILRRSRRR